jgi:hypothetical protein
MASDIAFNKKATGGTSVATQRLVELDTVMIENARFDAFDQKGFEHDFRKELTEGHKVGITAFHREFNEVIVSLGQHVPWFNEQFEEIANPKPGDPHRTWKEKQYISCLLKLRQMEIARLRNSGQNAKADTLEKDLNLLEGLHEDIAHVDGLLQRLTKVGVQKRNVFFRLLPPASMAALFFYYGDVSALWNDTTPIDMDTVKDPSILLARIMCLIFTVVALQVALPWLINLCTKHVCACCQDSSDGSSMSCAEKRGYKTLGSISNATDQFFKDVQGLDSDVQGLDSDVLWTSDEALKWLFGPGVVNPDETMPDERASVSRVHQKRCTGVAKSLPLRIDKTEHAEVTAMVNFVRPGYESKVGCCRRHCTASKRQKSADINTNTKFSENDEVQLFLRLATWRYRCKEIIDETFRRLSQQLKDQMQSKQCGFVATLQQHASSAEAEAETEGQIHTRMPASVAVRSIVTLAEFHAEKQRNQLNKYLIVGTLLCASSPWLHELVFSCTDSRDCGFFNDTVINETVINGTDVWVTCEGISPPCDVLPVYVQGHLCITYPTVLHATWNQPHICDGFSVTESIWRLIAAATEMSLTFKIFNRLLDVLKGYQQRRLFMESFVTCVPWHGMDKYLRGSESYGLLPQWDLNTNNNVVAYNRIRVFLQTYESKEFSQEQQQVFWVVCITIGAMVVKIASSLGEPRAATGMLVDTLALKVCILQLMGLVVILWLLYTGVETTRLQEHGLRHILLLKRAQLWQSEDTASRPLFFAVAKTLEVLMPTTTTLCDLQESIQHKLGISIPSQTISVHGLLATGTTKSINRHEYTKLWETLLDRMAAGCHLSNEDREQLQWLQQWLRSDDKVLTKGQLHAAQRKLQSANLAVPEAVQRLEWIDSLLRVSTAPRESQEHSPHEQPHKQSLSPRRLARTRSRVRSDSVSLHSLADAARQPILLKWQQASQDCESSSSEERALDQAVEVTAAARGKRLFRPSVEERGGATPSPRLDLRIGEAAAPSADGAGPLADVSAELSRQRSDVRRVFGASLAEFSVVEKLQGASRAAAGGSDIESGSQGIADPSWDCYGGVKWGMFHVDVHDGRDISVTQAPIKRKHMDMLRALRRSHSNMLDIAILGQKDRSLQQAFWRGSFPAGAPPQADRSGLRSSSSLDRETFDAWRRLDTLRHMLDSLISLLEEERVPQRHLPMIEDTRPTIRIPIYGPLPLTTQLFAAVASSMLGAVVTSVCLLVSRF